MLCDTLSITAMRFMTSILVIRAHSYQLAQYGSEGVKVHVLAIALLTHNLSSASQSRKWQLISMS